MPWVCPGKIGIWTEDGDGDGDGKDEVVKINTLDEAALFSFFFADVASAPGFSQFAGMIKSLGEGCH